MDEKTFDDRVKAIAYMIGAMLTAVAQALGYAPPSPSTLHFIDLGASAVCAVAALYYGYKHWKANKTA